MTLDAFVHKPHYKMRYVTRYVVRWLDSRVSGYCTMASCVVHIRDSQRLFRATANLV